MPAIRLPLKTLRLQVSDTSPLFGPTTMSVEPDGLLIDRPLMKTKYLWPAFRNVEIAKNAIVLAIDNGIGLIVPASAFTSDAERYDFAAAISKYVASTAPAEYSSSGETRTL